MTDGRFGQRTQSSTNRLGGDSKVNPEDPSSHRCPFATGLQGNDIIVKIEIVFNPGFFLDVFLALEDSGFAGNLRFLGILP